MFASDLAPVLAQPGVDHALDDAYVAAVLLHRIPGGAETFFRAVRTVPPGHSLTVDGDTERLERWWRPEDAPAVRNASDDDYAAAFLDHYRRAVRDRLRGACVPGAHLSGGLDSSSIAVLAAREWRPNGPLHAFCWHPPPIGGLADVAAAEYGRIKAVCIREGLSPIYHAANVEHLVTALRRDGARAPDRDGTLGQESSIQESAAGMGVDVLLSGWGGDECASFNGRGYYAGLLREGRLVEMVRNAREETNSPVRHLLMHAVLRQLHPNIPRFARLAVRGRLPRPQTFVRPAFARLVRGVQSFPRATGVRDMQLGLLRYGHLAQRVEDWAAAGARQGIEYRYPLLDRRLIEFALGLPPDQFRRGSWNRWLMRNALRDILPPEVCWNPSKREVAHREQGRQAVTDTLAIVRHHLTARSEPPSRAKYLNMPQVLAHLEVDDVEAIRRPGKFFAALTFLDW